MIQSIHVRAFECLITKIFPTNFLFLFQTQEDLSQTTWLPKMFFRRLSCRVTVRLSNKHIYTWHHTVEVEGERWMQRQPKWPRRKTPSSWDGVDYNLLSKGVFDRRGYT